MSRASHYQRCLNLFAVITIVCGCEDRASRIAKSGAVLLSTEKRLDGSVSMSRPFGISPITGLESFDGWFLKEAGQQQIGVYLQNSGSQLDNVTALFSLPPESGIVMGQSSFDLGTFAPNTTRLALFDADFSQAQQGKYHATVALWTPTGDECVDRDIFVASATGPLSSFPDGIAQSAAGFVPEGQTLLSFGEIFGHVQPEFSYCSTGTPVNFTQTVDYATPYSGQFGPIPFQDPWWKVAAAIVAGAGGVGYIVNGIVRVCKPGYSDSRTAAAVSDIACGAVALGGTVLAFDDIDLFRRGEQNTMPDPGELTVRETVTANAEYLQEPRIGTDFTEMVTFQFVRTTNQRDLVYTVSTPEPHQNQHVVTSHSLTSDRPGYHPGETIALQALITDGSGVLLAPGSAYAVAMIDMNRDGGTVRYVMLEPSPDGRFTGSYLVRQSDLIGPWDLFLFAQTVNQAPPDGPPEERARQIGGIMLAAPDVGTNFIIPDLTVTISP